MCLLLFALKEHPDYPLVVAANRDEFYRRPTAAAAFWDDAPHILAGRDQERGGTWLGVNRDGRWAAVTSFREPASERHDTSRGHLVSEYLAGAFIPAEYANRVLERGHRYAGFNLLVGDAEQVVYLSNRGAGCQTLQRGVYGLSNHLLYTPWPKLEQAKAEFTRVVSGLAGDDPQPFFELLGSRDSTPDERLPQTGLGLELERLLSSAFIASPELGYGTRSSTVLMCDGAGRVCYTERTFVADNAGKYVPGRYRETTHRTRICAS